MAPPPGCGGRAPTYTRLSTAAGTRAARSGHARSRDTRPVDSREVEPIGREASDGGYGAAVRTRLSILMGLVRFGRGLARFLAEPITPEHARRTILARLARREQTFLEMLEHAVFAYPRSPYRQLFRAAGCELGDVRALVARDGVENTLVRLRDAGVFVRFEEYKGAAPTVRGSQTFHFLESDFDNPLPAGVCGWTGEPAGRRVGYLIDLDYLADRAPLWCLWFQEHGLLDARWWF